MLSDFGLAVVVEDLTAMSVSSVLQGSGNCRWMALELLFDDHPPTKSSDMWAFGMVMLEVRVLEHHNSVTTYSNGISYDIAALHG